MLKPNFSMNQILTCGVILFGTQYENDNKNE